MALDASREGLVGNFNWEPPPAAKPADKTDALVAEAAQMVGEQNRDEYEHLVRAAAKMVAEGNTLQKAIKKCRKAISLFPGSPAAYRTLGAAQEASGSPSAAAQSYVEATAKASVGKEDPRIWADCAAQAYAMLVACPEVPRPEWWVDEALLRHSEKAYLLLPDDLRAAKWRADVLSGLRESRKSKFPRRAGALLTCSSDPHCPQRVRCPIINVDRPSCARQRRSSQESEYLAHAQLLAYSRSRRQLRSVEV